jgi:hypothetical protein
MSGGVSCRAPLSNEQLVAYWANDLEPAAHDAVEEHLFACDGCLANAERVAQLARVFRSSLPPVVSRGDIDTLRAQGAAIRENVFEPSKRQTVTFEPGVDILIHRLTGLDLASAERVEVTVRNESGGPLIFEELFAPFDRERGEVLIACQRHFAAYPPDVVFDVRVHRPAREVELATYIIPHVFAP